MHFQRLVVHFIDDSGISEVVAIGVALPAKPRLHEVWLLSCLVKEDKRPDATRVGRDLAEVFLRYAWLGDLRCCLQDLCNLATSQVLFDTLRVRKDAHLQVIWLAQTNRLQVDLVCIPHRADRWVLWGGRSFGRSAYSFGCER